MYPFKFQWRTLIVLIAATAFACKNEEKKVEPNDLRSVLAIVGEDTIFLGDYKKRVSELKQEKPDLESEVTRRKILDDMVAYYLVIMEGRSQKLQDHPYVQFQVRTKEDELYYAHAIRKAIVEPLITEDQLKTRYEKLKEQLDVQHIYIGYDKSFDPNLEMAINQKKIIRFQLAAKFIADSLYTILQKEPNKFGSFVEQFSDDVSTKFFDGTIKGLRRGNIPDEIGDELFELSIGEFSRPIDDGNGYHIYKILNKNNTSSLVPYEEAKSSIKDKIAQQSILKSNPKIEQNKKDFVEKLLQDGSYNFIQINASTWHSKYQKYDLKISLYDQLSEDELNTVLATSMTDTIKVRDLVFALTGNRNNSRITLAQIEYGIRNAMTVRLVSRWAKEQKIELTNRESHFIKIIESGLIYNRIQPPTVNIKLADDTSNIQRYFEANSSNYRMPDSADLGIILMKDEDNIKVIVESIKLTKNFEKIFNELKKKSPTSAIRYDLRPVQEYGSLSLRIKDLNEGDVSDFFKMNDGMYGIVKIYKKTIPQIYPLAKIYERVKSDYIVSLIRQNKEQWLTSLKDKYKPTVNYQSLHDAFEIKLK